MWKKLIILLSSIALLAATACSAKDAGNAIKADVRQLMLTSNNNNEERNRLFKEDIEYLQKELPKRHKNLFSKITKEEFDSLCRNLINKVDQLDNKHLLVDISKIIAAVGDAHTNINIWDGYLYPLQFWLFDDGVYIVNADARYEDMIFSKVLKIDGTDIETVKKILSETISYENESWLKVMLQNNLRMPAYLYGSGIQQNENQATFTVEKDGEITDFTVNAIDYFSENINYAYNDSRTKFYGKYEKYYAYEYMDDYKALYFEYNVCDNMNDLSFKEFNKDMMNFIEKNKPEKIIVDVRNNTGGNSEVLNPFTNALKDYIKKNNNVEVYILIGRNTFSSGMFAVFRVKEAAAEAVSIGEATGGALDCYGDIKKLILPNSALPVSYSTKYFEFSKMFAYESDDYSTYLPDEAFNPTIEDYRNGIDSMLEYVLKK